MPDVAGETTAACFYLKHLYSLITFSLELSTHWRATGYTICPWMFSIPFEVLKFNVGRCYISWSFHRAGYFGIQLWALFVEICFRTSGFWCLLGFESTNLSWCRNLKNTFSLLGAIIFHSPKKKWKASLLNTRHGLINSDQLKECLWFGLPLTSQFPREPLGDCSSA